MGRLRFFCKSDFSGLQIFEIERHGKPRDTNTTYEAFPIGKPDDTTLADLPEAPAVVGGIILNKSFEELEEYVRTGYFPENGVALRGERPAESEEPPRRRTPAGRNEDKF